MTFISFTRSDSYLLLLTFPASSWSKKPKSAPSDDCKAPRHPIFHPHDRRRLIYNVFASPVALRNAMEWLKNKVRDVCHKSDKLQRAAIPYNESLKSRQFITRFALGKDERHRWTMMTTATLKLAILDDPYLETGARIVTMSSSCTESIIITLLPDGTACFRG